MKNIQKGQLRTDTLNPISKNLTKGERLFNCLGALLTLGILGVGIWVMCSL
jgi:hypothetical protein